MTVTVIEGGESEAAIEPAAAAVIPAEFAECIRVTAEAVAEMRGLRNDVAELAARLNARDEADANAAAAELAAAEATAAAEAAQAAAAVALVAEVAATVEETDEETDDELEAGDVANVADALAEVPEPITENEPARARVRGFIKL